MYGAVPTAPVKVMFGVLPKLHTDVLPDMVATGKGRINIVAVPVCGWLQFTSATLTKL